MSKIECLENQANVPAVQEFDRKAFWLAFGEVAPKKTAQQKRAKQRTKFWKRFTKKLPDACAKISVRLLLVVLAVSALLVSGINPLRIIASKFI